MDDNKSEIQKAQYRVRKKNKLFTILLMTIVLIILIIGSIIFFLNNDSKSQESKKTSAKIIQEASSSASISDTDYLDDYDTDVEKIGNDYMINGKITKYDDTYVTIKLKDGSKKAFSYDNKTEYLIFKTNANTETESSDKIATKSTRDEILNANNIDKSITIQFKQDQKINSAIIIYLE